MVVRGAEGTDDQGGGSVGIPPTRLSRVEPRARAWLSERPALDSPLAPAGILLIAATCFVLLRVLVAGHGDISTFVQAGSQFVDPKLAPHGLAVRPGSGYDGQYYYRLALQPWNLSWNAHGITFDMALRRQRILYPWLTWISSAGRAALVPYMLVAVNVLGMAATGLFSGRWSQSLGRHALWGLLPAGYFGLVWSLSRDLTEITAMALVIAGIVAWRSSR